MEYPETHHREDDEALEAIFRKLEKIERILEQMAIDQATFDTDLAGLVAAETANGQAVAALVSAVDAFVAAHPEIDFSAEDSSVQSATADAAAAAQALADELSKLNPTPPTP